MTDKQQEFLEVLSSETQVVLDAFRTSHTGQGPLAAALRAAARYCKRDTLFLFSLADELDAPYSY